MSSLLAVSGLTKSFTTRRNGKRVTVQAVRGVSLDVEAQTTLGIVGESGSGKSTTGRLMARLIEPDDGAITLRGQDLRAARGKQLRQLRRRMPMVFQDPFASLDPTWLIADILREPRVPDAERRDPAALLDMVQLPAAFARRYSYELSGGQRQRVSIARALACNPELVILDESVAALDVSTRASIITLLQDLQEESGIGYVFISHDLDLVRSISSNVAVMYLGRVVEDGDAATVYRAPAHPYTRALIDSLPVADPVVQKKRVTVPIPPPTHGASDLPVGCAFQARCPIATDLCRTVDPALTDLPRGTRVACHYPLAV